ncbi:hypothetical protein N431DRAFT_564508, partial [Stipitochalara longipes BDJ]
MLLHELNDDILQLITSELDTEAGKIDLINLSLTCRRLSELARPVIPRTVCLVMPSPQLELFKRSLAENPTYGDGVLRLWKIATNRPTWARGCPELHLLLCKLPNIRTCTIGELSSSGDPFAHKLLSCHLPLRNSLRHLPVEERLPTAFELISRVSLVFLHCVRIFDENEFRISDDALSHSEINEWASPQTLDFRSRPSVYISPSALQGMLFSCSGSVQKLVTNIPVKQQWIEDPSHQSTWYSSSRILRTFSGALLTPVFAPVSQNLTHLEISQGCQEWLGHDGTRLDLSSFVALKHVTASALCFVPPLGLGYSRDGLYKLLPRSLERIQLDFGFEIGVFYCMHSGKLDKLGRRQFVSETMDPRSYNWITELAKHKSDHLQSLQEVLFYEDNSGYGQVFKWEKWDPPLSVDWAFDAAGVDLAVYVRSPP